MYIAGQRHVLMLNMVMIGEILLNVKMEIIVLIVTLELNNSFIQRYGPSDFLTIFWTYFEWNANKYLAIMVI